MRRKFSSVMKLYKIDWDCAMMQFQDTTETTIIKAQETPSKEQIEKTIEDLSTGTVYVNSIAEVNEKDIRHNTNNVFYEI